MAEKEPPSGEIDRSSDVLTTSDFSDLEKQENKKSLLKRIFKKSGGEDASSQEKPPEAIPQLSKETLSFEFQQLSKKLDSLMVTVEMQGGKLDMEKELRSALNERIIDLSSQLGELRSMLISKERFFDKIEAEFVSFKEIVDIINPTKTQEEFDKKEFEMTKIDAKAEKNQSHIVSLQENLSQFSEQMTKLGSFQDLITTLNQLDGKVKNVLVAKEKSEHVLVKMEAMFLDLNKKSNLIETINSLTKENQNKHREAERQITKLTGKIDSLPTKNDFDRIKEALETVKEGVFNNDMHSFDLKNYEPKASHSQSTSTTKNSNHTKESAEEPAKNDSQNLDPKLESMAAFIHKSLNTGHTLEFLQEKLLNVGWTKEQIDVAYAHAQHL